MTLLTFLFLFIFILCFRTISFYFRALFTLLENMGKFVLSLDVGTTTIRAYVYDHNGIVLGSDCDKVS